MNFAHRGLIVRENRSGSSELSSSSSLASFSWTTACLVPSDFLRAVFSAIYRRKQVLVNRTSLKPRKNGITANALCVAFPIARPNGSVAANGATLKKVKSRSRFARQSNRHIMRARARKLALLRRELFFVTFSSRTCGFFEYQRRIPHDGLGFFKNLMTLKFI